MKPDLPFTPGYAEQLGADVVIDRHAEDFVAVVNEVTEGHGADIIYDPVGGDTYRRSTKCIAFEGRILVVGFAGEEIQEARLNHTLVKNYPMALPEPGPNGRNRLPGRAHASGRPGRPPAARVPPG